MLVQRILYNRETRYISLITFIYIMKKLLSHYVCETCIIDNTWCCKLLFPKHVISHFSPMCYSALTNVHKPISQSHKIVCVCISLQAPPMERARAPVSALLWKWVINCVLESMEFQILQLKTSLHPRRTSSLGSGFEPYWFQLKIIQVIVTIRSKFSVCDT